MADAIDEIAPQLTALCRFETRDAEASVGNIRALPGHAGFGYSFELSYRDASAAPRNEKLVLRVAPPGVRIAGPADVVRQAKIMASLADTAVPVPPVRWYGDDPQWFARPYSVVGFVEGANLLPETGQASAETITRAARSAITALVELHQVDWQSRRDAWGEPYPLTSELDRLDHLLNRPTLDAELIKLAPTIREKLRATIPADARIGCVHGDFQWSNCLFVDGQVRAVIDWELSQVSATPLDLGWFCLFCDPAAWVGARVLARNAPGPETISALYEEISQGAAPRALVNWFRAFSGYRFGVISAFNLMLHRRGKRHDPAWEDIAKSVPRLFERGLELLG